MVQTYRARYPWGEYSQRLAQAPPGKEKQTGELQAAMQKIRKEISEQCLRHASDPDGVYLMSAPTGCGKTVACLRYAVAKAQRQVKRHVIYLAPNRALLEQAAVKFGKIFRKQDVAIICGPGERGWNRPVICLTADTFIVESERIPEIRELSVIILDEPQSLPAETLGALARDAADFSGQLRSTLILCTATPDGISERIHIDGELVKYDPAWDFALRRVLRRTPEHVFRNTQELADYVRNIQGVSILVIADSTEQGQELFNALEETTPAIERQIINLTSEAAESLSGSLKEAAQALSASIPCTVVAGPFAESGLSFSFEHVVRIGNDCHGYTQAAGRCNRYGEYRQGGWLHILRYKN